MINIVLIYTGPTILLILWFLFRHRNSARLFLSGAWIVVMVVAAIVGAVMWQTNHECTRAASAIFLASGVIFIGPFLIVASPKNWHAVWPIFATAILPYLSAWACAIILLYLGQAWV
jgi:uncharacterized membrane protein